MMKPTVHMNGTSRAALIEGYLQAACALERAMAAIALAYPNGRDYYPQGDQAISQAMTEHYDRLRRVKAVKQEIEDLAMSVQDDDDRRAILGDPSMADNSEILEGEAWNARRTDGRGE